MKIEENADIIFDVNIYTKSNCFSKDLTCWADNDLVGPDLTT